METESIQAPAMGRSRVAAEGPQDTLHHELRVKGRAQSLSYSGSTASANPSIASGEFSLKGGVPVRGQGVSGRSGERQTGLRSEFSLLTFCFSDLGMNIRRVILPGLKRVCWMILHLRTPRKFRSQGGLANDDG